MKHLFALALAWVSVAAFAQITYTDYSGSITTGGTSQTLAPASNGRVRIAILNPATETENLCVNLTSAASCTPGSSWILQSGQSIVLDSTEAVTVVAATTGHKWIAKAGVGAGFAANGGGSGGGGGGAVTLASGAVSSGAYAAGSLSAGAGVDGWDLTQGAKADSVCGTDTGTCSVVALLKKANSNLTTLAGSNAQLPTSLGQTIASGSLSVVQASDQTSIVAQGSTTSGQKGNLTQGAVTTAAPSYTNGQTSPISLTTGGAQRVADVALSATANADANRFPVSVDIASPVTGTSAAAGVLSNMPFAVGKSAQGVIVDITAFTATSVLFEQSSDGTAAYVLTLCYQSTATGAGSRASSTAATGKWECPVWGTHFRLSQTGSGGVTATVTPISRPIPSVTTVYVANVPNVIGQTAQGSSVGNTPFLAGLEARTTTGTAVSSGQAVRLTGTTDGKAIVLTGTVPELAWNYAAAASGIVNTTTAVTVKAACTDRCYVNRLDIMCEALTNATEVVLRDGAATVLWRTKVGTGGLPLQNITFQPPRRGASAQLIEVATLTASGAGACYVNVDGYDAK